MPLAFPAVVVWLGAVQSPISQVTVFTDQARVVRQAQVTAPGVVEFPPLPDTIDASSVRVEAQGAEVRRVELEPLTPEAFRTAEAKQVLAELDAVDTELARLASEAQALREHREVLSRLRPVLPPADNVRPLPKLSPQGWAAALQFQATQLEAAQKKLRDVELAQRAAMKRRDALVDKADKLGNPERRSGWRVAAVLAGGGQATVSLTYLVRRARWTPTWDVQLDPEKSLVTVSLAGLVSQESGEDWDDAQLTLSTAIPSSAVKAPKLLTWKIGTTERFIPTPTPVQELVRVVPPLPPPVPVRTEEALVRGWLAQSAGRAVPATLEEPAKPALGYRAGEEQTKRRAKERPPPPPPPPEPMPRPQAMGPAPSMAPGAAVSGKSFSFADESVEGDLAQPESEAREETALTTLSVGGRTRSDRAASQPVAAFSLSPPPGYRAPTYGADSPVTLAGGYDLSFGSRQKETIPSAKGARRVALWSQQWPVTVERKVYPALAKEAYLSAELKNPSQQVLPGGPATLSVGADPAGTAQLKLVSPGEAFTLPLGLDRAIKTVRNVQVVDATEGVVSKDDVSTYAVTIELVNPYRAPVALRVFDQWPLAQPNQKDVETKLLDSKPGAIQDAPTGRLEWRLTLKPNEKQVLTYSYQVKRPKSWRLYQQEVRP
ncbi:MAG: mucoidy inhibitor MuiA family protein [Myxococcaceae bacterium]|nr:mucoidy inhibitor MuiA family protein [Myxococcaceae bacterium]